MADLRNEDVRKLHGEINQITNQRFLLTTLAVTVFGVVTAWLLPRSGVGSASAASGSGLSYVAATVLLVLLFLLYVVSHTLKRTLRTLTTYLEVFTLSEWEGHWKAYRKDGYYAYTRTQTTFFIVLGVLVAAFCLAMQWPSAQQTEAYVAAAFLILYVILICGMGYWGWWDSEGTARARWITIKNEAKAPCETAPPRSAA